MCAEPHNLRYITGHTHSFTGGWPRKVSLLTRSKSNRSRSTPTWSSLRFASTCFLLFVIPLAATQRSFAQHSKARESTQEAPSTVALGSELDPLRDCIARSDKRCAIEAFSRLHDPKLNDDPQYLDLSAQVMSLEHKDSEALVIIDRAIAMEPAQASYVLTKAKIFQRSHDQLAAIQLFLQAAQLRPRWVEPVYSLGMSFFILGNEEKNNEYYDRGARHFKAALELDPKCHKAEFMLGLTEAVEEHFEKGKEHFEKALKMNPQNAYYHLHYGILLNRMGDSDGALHEMKFAESLDHSNPLAHFNLGRLEAQLDNYSVARRELEAAVQLDPNLSVAYYWLGKVYFHLKLSELSRTAYKNFELAKARNQQEETDPVDSAISPSDSQPLESAK